MKLKRRGDDVIGELIYDPDKEYHFTVATGNALTMRIYKNLADLYSDWEDMPEEPFSTSFYTIVDGKIKHCIFYRERVAGCPDDAWAYLKDGGRERIKQLKEVGLYFDTLEEAELAVRKLKAFKWLKDKGFKFEDMDVRLTEYPGARCELCIDAVMPADAYTDKGVDRDLGICFGGEE